MAASSMTFGQERQRMLALMPRNASRRDDLARVAVPERRRIARPSGLRQPADPPVAIPAGHVGPVVLPGTGRMVWWTGRVAIGLRHQPDRRLEPVSQSALWVQQVILDGRIAA